ncbi:MAG: hypothetical protein QFX35_02855 [Candidatus Verstraetearchaeota archaeon]|nr:hypothetical protein [Candidatus Verstraetearchaeota archaeon]
MLSIIIISNAVTPANAYSELPSDGEISAAASEYFNYLKGRGYPIQSYQAIKVHKAGGWYGGSSEIVNYVIFVAYWQQGSYYNDGPYAILVQGSGGAWSFREPLPGEYHLLEGYSLGWVSSNGGGGGGGGDDGSDEFPLEVLIGLIVLVAVIAGLGFFGKNLAAGKKGKTPSAKAAFANPPPPQASGAATATQAPAPQVDPDVQRWIDNNPVYSGYWMVTPDGRYVTNTINPLYTIPVDWIKGTSSYPDAEIFSTLVPEKEHETFGHFVGQTMKIIGYPNLHDFTKKSWDALSDDQKKARLKEFSDMLAELHEIPKIDVDFDPNSRFTGYYDWNSNPPKIVIRSNGDEWNSPEYLLGTISHELQHHIQTNFPNKLKGGTPQYINAMNKNLANYTHYDVDPVQYAGQLMERDAESIRKHISRNVSRVAYERKLEMLVESVWGENGLNILKSLKARARVRM